MSVDRKTAPTTYPFGTLVMPAETVEQLPNGITFHRYIGGDQPVVNISLHFTGGTVEMGEATAKLTTGMLTEGTASRSAEDLAEVLDYYGARIATRTLAHRSVIELSLLSSTAGDMLEVLADMLVHPSFPAERLELNKLRAKNVVRSADCSPANVADKAIRPLLYGPTNAMAHSMTEEDIDSVSREDIVAAHQRLMCPSAIHAYMSGLADDSTVAQVCAFLGSLPQLGQGYAMNIEPCQAAAPGTIVHSIVPGAMQSAVHCALPTIGRDHPDFVALRFTIMALGGYFGSRLMANIREEKGLTYGISAWLSAAYEGASANISTLTAHSSVDMVIEEIRREMGRMATEPPSGDELETFRTYAMTGLAELLDNPLSVMQYYGTQNLVGAPEGYFEEQQRVLQSLTPDRIARISAQYLNPDDLLISLT